MFKEYGDMTPEEARDAHLEVRNNFAYHFIDATKSLAEMREAATSNAELKDARKFSKACQGELVFRLEDNGFPLEDFSTPDGTRIVIRIKVEDPKPKPGMEQKSKKWLAKKGNEIRNQRPGKMRTGKLGERGASIAHRMRRQGQSFPSDLFEPMQDRVVVWIA